MLVFIASEYEDLGRITCGNAILSGTMPLCPYTEVAIREIPERVLNEENQKIP